MKRPEGRLWPELNEDTSAALVANLFAHGGRCEFLRFKYLAECKDDVALLLDGATLLELSSVYVKAVGLDRYFMPSLFGLDFSVDWRGSYSVMLAVETSNGQLPYGRRVRLRLPERGLRLRLEELAE